MTSTQMGLTTDEQIESRESAQDFVQQSAPETGQESVQESMFEQASFEQAAFDQAKFDQATYDEPTSDQAMEYPGHDLEQLPEEAEAFTPATRNQYAEPSLTEVSEPPVPEPPVAESTEPESPVFSSVLESQSGTESGQATGQHPQVVSESNSEATEQPLTMDDFTALEERVLRAVGLVRRERQARIAAEERAALLELNAKEQEANANRQEAKIGELVSEIAQLQNDGTVADQLQQEVDSLRAEREQVRQRVERLLGQLDALEL